MAPVPFGQWAIKIKPGCFLRPYKDNHHNLVDTVYERKFIVTKNLFPVTVNKFPMTGNKFHVTGNKFSLTENEFPGQEIDFL